VLLLRTICFTALGLLVGAASIAAAEEPKFRTDGGDASLPWYQVEYGKFPPPGSAHAVAGELIELDHLNRTGMLRPDRDDTQKRPQWDIARPFEMLPYGSFRYRGAPAELRDIPIGTHLHGLVYLDEVPPGVLKKGIPRPEPRPESFNRYLLLEDDFSYMQRHDRLWLIESLATDLTTSAVTGINAVAVGADGAKPADAKAKNFVVTPATRIWKGTGFGTIADLAPEQKVLVNLTVCTLKGPGRCTDIWLDAESRALATAQQLEVHRLYMREHGLAGWVDHVDNDKGIVTVTFFGGFDPKLREQFVMGENVTAAVAEPNLRTYDQINDRKSGPLVELLDVPAEVGSSGFRLRFKPSELLEGFRPQRVIRVWSARWKVDDLPREEKLY
jgi:hypothetical protein